MLFREWRQEPRTSLPRHWACHQLTSASTTIKKHLGSCQRDSRQSRNGQRKCQSSSSSSVQSGKIMGYQKDHLPLIRCVCFEKEGAKAGFALSWKVVFVCLLARIIWDLASFQWHCLNLPNSNIAACITNVLVNQPLVLLTGSLISLRNLLQGFYY